MHTDCGIRSSAMPTTPLDMRCQLDQVPAPPHLDDDKDDEHDGLRPFSGVVIGTSIGAVVWTVLTLVLLQMAVF